MLEIPPGYRLQSIAEYDAYMAILLKFDKMEDALKWIISDKFDSRFMSTIVREALADD